MSAEFDPYRKWLGIPPHELPPDHYRLLGIAQFEDDPDVIENAANRQMAHVRTFQSGRHGPLSQQILNELSTARVCLLNPDKKQQYDALLRAQLVAASPDPPIGGIPVAPPRPVVAPAPLTAPSVERLPPPVPIPPGPAVGRISPVIPHGVAAPSPVPVGSPVQVRGAVRVQGKPLVATAPVRSRSSVASRHAARRRSSTLPMILGLIGAAILIGAAVVVFNTDLTKFKQPTAPDPGRPRPASQPGGGERPAVRPRPTVPSSLPPAASSPMPTQPGSFADLVADNPAKSNEPQPDSPSLASMRQQQYRDAVQTARAALADRDTGQAMRELERAGDARPNDTQAAELERLRALRVYLDGFWDGVRRAIAEDLKAGQAFEHRGARFEVVGFEADVVQFKVDGREQERPIRELEIPHALAFASRAFAEDDVFGKVYVAALLVLDRQSAGNAEHQASARRLLAEAARMSGDPNPYVAAELGIDPDRLRSPADPPEPSDLPAPSDLPEPSGPPEPSSPDKPAGERSEGQP